MHKSEVQIGDSGQDINPDLLRFEPFSPEYLKDPYPFMAYAREVAPALIAPNLIIGSSLATKTYAASFSRRPASRPRTPLPRLQIPAPWPRRH
jgi:hypothetical protein